MNGRRGHLEKCVNWMPITRFRVPPLSWHEVPEEVDQSLDLPPSPRVQIGATTLSFGGSSGTCLWMRWASPTATPQVKQERQTHKLELHRTEGSKQNDPQKVTVLGDSTVSVYLKPYWGRGVWASGWLNVQLRSWSHGSWVQAHVGLCIDSTEPAWDSPSLPPFLPTFTLFLSLKINKLKKKTLLRADTSMVITSTIKSFDTQP